MSPVLVNVELKICKKCMQMTNHMKKIYEYPEKKIVYKCLKCEPIKVDLK